MAMVKNTEVALKDSSVFNHHRFDNYGAWLDRELRNKRRVRGEPEGFGFAVPRPPAPARKEKPFMVQEVSMTSGLLVTRRYVQKDTDYPIDTLRSDPYHYPNHLQVQEEGHYEDRRARSQHIDPRVREKNEIPRDKVLREAVPDEMVKNIIMSGMKDMKYKVDPDVLKIQFDPNIRPQKETVRELNVDLSCVDLPAKEKPESTSASSRLPPGHLGRDWKWCLGGRKPIPPPDHGDVNIHRTQSLPGTLSGKSLLRHQSGATPGPFHGSTYRSNQTPSMRVRGGQNAIDGFSGTFPNTEVRPGV